MSGLDALPSVREVIDAEALRAQKSLGQNFLTDLNITDRIVREAGDVTQTCAVEIGPGPGGLTRSLLAAGAMQVVVIEKDQRFLPALEQIANACPDRLQICHADALATDISEIVDRPYRIIANLPYNVATPLVIGWLSEAWPQSWQSMTLMFQKEVADRLVATVGQKAYGRLAVLAQSRAKVRRLFDLPPQAFSPPPKVTSTVVHFQQLAQSPRTQAKDLEKITQAAFGQRRKMLRQSLKSVHTDATALLNMAGIDPQRRAETLSLEEFEQLTLCWLESRH